MVKSMVPSESAPLSCVFQVFVEWLVMCIGGAGAGGNSQSGDLQATADEIFLFSL